MSRTLSSRTLTWRSRNNPDWLVGIGTNPVLPTQPVTEDHHQSKDTDALTATSSNSGARKDNYGTLDIEAPNPRTLLTRLPGEHPAEAAGKMNTVQQSTPQDSKLGRLVQFSSE